ncbi:hypothetical protein JCM10908_003829 [Rhodotorula pacifica]|uniref:uncharacterized protein n=1 Tax=Rhodotorula pacifica TaxID=1495444 RepID=UPI00316DEA83
MSQSHEQDPHVASAAGSSSAPPPIASTSTSNSLPNMTAAVRLPSVSLPSADLFETAAFVGGRRQSINSDPFLHAFSAAHDPATGSSRSAEPYRLPSAGQAQPPYQNGAHANGVDGHEHGLHGRWQPGLEPAFPYGQPSGSMPHGGPFGQAGNGEQHYPPPHSSVGPLSSYRFGGPSQPLPPTSAGGVASVDAPPFIDYTMSRKSPSHAPNEPVSPRRTPSGRSTPMAGMKRKARDEGGESQHGLPAFPGALGHHAGGPPEAKRQPSAAALGYDKAAGPPLPNGHTSAGANGPDGLAWEEQRRESGGSYASSGGHSYSMTSYSGSHSLPPPLPSAPYESRPPSNYAANPASLPPGPPWDGRGQPAHYPHLEQANTAPYARRPSMPSVSQMMQGLPPDFVAGPSAPQAGPPGSARPGQPLLMVSSVPPTPTEREHPRQPRSASNPAFQPGEVVLPHAAPHGGPPPPDWQHRSHPPTRQNSSGSVHLDPTSSLPSGLMSKDSPYSRSPELRVSHKLAERKRRKEMTQLFEDLRESLPFERGLKASKWEILSKAIDYVAQLKIYSAELAHDNQNLRQHYGLPPGPVLTMPEGHLDGSTGGYDEHAHQQNHGGSHPGASGMANAAAPPRQLHWHEQRMDHEPAQDLKPITSHYAGQTGHSPVIPSRLHAQFGTSSHNSTPQHSPSLPPPPTSGRNSPAAGGGSGSPHSLERAMTGAPVSAA